MPPKHQRRSHTKSKSGCSQCKVRRIKCDEVRPACYNCERRHIKCDFSLPPKSSTSPRRSDSNDGLVVNGDVLKPPNLKTSPSSQATPQQTAKDPFDAPDLVSTKQTSDLDMGDLRLLHHFTIAVAPHMANPVRSDSLSLWQDHLVKLAFKHDFLMRGILAIAAYHLAYYTPDRNEEYRLIASKHQSLALGDFQEVLAQVDESNCHALFGFSCLLIVMTFASSTKTRPNDFNTDVLQWFHLLRGAKIVLDMHSGTIKCSFLKPLLDEMAYTENAAAYAIPGADRISDLFRICGVSNHERETSQAYTLAIHSLLSTFTQASICRTRGDGTILPSLVWPVNLPPRFVDLLSEKQPEALIILAHYCVLIQWAETTDDWFIGGWGRYMLETIKDGTPDDWQEHLKWPEEMLTAI